jgi:hypothetical protein
MELIKKKIAKEKKRQVQRESEIEVKCATLELWTTLHTLSVGWEIGKGNRSILPRALSKFL